jgi:molecular chaperone GrpE (heat shock protein)
MSVCLLPDRTILDEEKGVAEKEATQVNKLLAEEKRKKSTMIPQLDQKIRRLEEKTAMLERELRGDQERKKQEIRQKLQRATAGSIESIMRAVDLNAQAVDTLIGRTAPRVAGEVAKVSNTNSRTTVLRLPCFRPLCPAKAAR